MTDTALLVIDAQVNQFADGVYGGDALLVRLQNLIAQARAADMPVVFIQNNGGENDPDQHGTEGWEIHPALPVEADDIIIQKFTTDSFHETPLGDELAARGIKRVIIAGMQTEYCVNATTRSAATHNYEVTLVADAHSTFDTSKNTAAEIIAQHNTDLGGVVTVKPAQQIDWGN